MTTTQNDQQPELSAEELCFSYFPAYIKLQYPKYSFGPHHISIIEHLMAVERGDIDRLAIFMPPRHGKTMLVSEFFPPWYLGRNPESQIIFTTYSFDRASDVGRKVRNQLADPIHRQIFKGCALSSDSKGANKLSTDQGGNMFSVGVGGPITGRGANLFIIDDPIKGRVDAESEIERGRLIDWFSSVAYTRLMPENSAIILVMTRWHFDDLAGHLLTEKRHENWTVINLPAMAEENDPLGRAEGDPLWPDKFGQVKLEKIRSTIQTRDWNALYQQRPLPEEGGMVNLGWFQRYNQQRLSRAIRYKTGFNGHPKNGVRQIVCSWDTAYKEEQINDPSACTIWAIRDDGYYLLWVYNERLDYPKLKKKIIRVHDYNAKFGLGPVPVLIEDKASGQSLIQDLKNSTNIPIIPIKPEGNKKVRMSRASAVIESGQVHLPYSCPWLVSYETQHARFPYDRHDDMVDSTSQFLTWASKPRRRRSATPKFWK